VIIKNKLHVRHENRNMINTMKNYRKGFAPRKSIQIIVDIKTRTGANKYRATIYNMVNFWSNIN